MPSAGSHADGSINYPYSLNPALYATVTDCVHTAMRSFRRCRAISSRTGATAGGEVLAARASLRAAETTLDYSFAKVSTPPPPLLLFPFRPYVVDCPGSEVL